MNSKLKYLASNMGWMSISGFASKVLVFLMVPFYTRVLSSEGYGLYDLGYTSVVLLAPLVSLNAGESIMRFAIVEKDKIAGYFSSAFAASLAGAIGGSLICLLIVLLGGFDYQVAECIKSVALLLTSNIVYILFSQFARGIDRVKDMALGGLLNSVLLVVLSIVFVVGFDLGVKGCYCATSFAVLAGGVFIGVRCRFWDYLVRPKLSLLVELARYGIPLSVNTLGWWVNSSFSRYAVALLCGVANAGLLSAAYKIPAIPKTIQQIFIQAWQISAIRDFDPDDRDGFFGKIYNGACCFSAMLTSVVVFLMPVIAIVMFSDEFYSAWIYVPILMVCILFDCLASVVGGIFTAVGNTRPIAASAAVSVFAAVVACIVFIPLFGIQGAALASALSSVVIWAVRLILSRKYLLFSIDWRTFVTMIAVIVVQVTFALAIPLSTFWYFVQVPCVLLVLLLALKSIGFSRLVAKVISKSGN